MNRLWLWLAIAAAPLVLLGFDIVPPQVASLAGLGAWLGPGIYLGIKGNGLAWQKRHWQSVGQFCRVQRRWAWGSLAALIALSALGVYAGIQDPPQASDEPITFGEHGIAFEVPAGWSYDASGRFLTGMEGLRSSTLWMDAFYQGGGDGLIVIAAIDVGEEVQRSDLEEVSSALASGFGPDATLQGETQTLEIDGRPAFKLFVSTRTPDGDESESELVMVFEGRTGIMLKCQYTSADSAPALRACDRITQTLDVKDPQALASPSSQPD
jgi:hypothetical protein